ncbi:MAG: hypothetical protein ACOY0T_13810 [Myxococcota bacterium]
MRALRIWTEIASWRWSPAVALVLGAVLYVAFAVLVIPDRIGNGAPIPSGGTASSLRAFAQQRATSFAASISPSVAEGENVATSTPSEPQARTTPAAPAVNAAHFPRRGFTPPLDRPEPPAPPPPPAPPAAPVVALPAAAEAAAMTAGQAAAAAAAPPPAAPGGAAPPPNAPGNPTPTPNPAAQANVVAGPNGGPPPNPQAPNGAGAGPNAPPPSPPPPPGATPSPPAATPMPPGTAPTPSGR